MSIDEKRTYDFTARLSFPRLVGTEGEKKAVDLIVKEFNAAGYNDVTKEPFKTSFANWVFVRFVFVPIGIFLMLLMGSFLISPFLTLGLIAILLIVAVKSLAIVDSSEITLSKNEKNNYTTNNIYVELKSKTPKAKIIFMGHYDTKSQTFSTAIRIGIFMIAILGDLLVMFVYLIVSVIGILMFFSVIAPIDFSSFNLVMFFVCLTLAIVGGLNFFNKTGNKSPGASDNAASVATVLELARYFKSNPMENIDLVFLIPSSEELNLGGAKHFIKTHKNEINPKNSYFINFDGIGGTGFIRLITAYGIPRKTSSKKLNDLLIKSAKELNIDARVIYLPTGAWSDFMPIIKAGYESCWLASSGSIKYVHTPKDSMDLVSKEALKNGLVLSVEVAKKLSEEFK